MSDVLQSLVERARGEVPAVRPVASRYGRARATPFEVVEEIDARAPTAEPRPTLERLPGEREVRRSPHPKPEQKAAPAQPQKRTHRRAVDDDRRRPEPAPQAAEAETTRTHARTRVATPATPLPHPVRPRRSHTDAQSSQRTRVESRAVEVENGAADPARVDGGSAAAVPLRPPKPERPRPAIRRRTTPASPPVEPGERTVEVRERLVFAREPTAAPPTVHISIGRVELRAAETPPRLPAPQLARPKQTLDDYLSERSRRSR